jgi:hypothetical protein
VRTCGRLLEDEGDVLAAQTLLLLARALGPLESGGEVQQVADLTGSEVEQFEKVAPA